jgi:two-component system sensor histidine kinase KdpD
MSGGAHAEDDDDLMLRALVQLTESQNQRIEGLRRATVDLQAQLQARRDVDVLLAHEIRTPLTVVTGVLSTLEAGGIDDDVAAQLLRRGLQQAEHLNDVIEDLLHPPDHRGTMFPRALLKEVPLADLVTQALVAVAARHPDFPPTVTVALTPGDLVVATAPSRLVAVLVNLLENAAKYADGAPVRIAGRIDDNRDLVVSVTDGGPGLSPDADPEQLFGAFARGTNATSAAHPKPGRGVGLYLVRNLVRSLGGEVTLANRADGATGTVASFVLPQRRAEDPVTRARHRAVATAGDASR